MKSLLTKQSHNPLRRSNQPRRFSTNLMSEITSNVVLDAALAEISKHREEDKDSSDIWELRRHWQAHKQIIREQLLAGIYYLSPVDHFGHKNGHALTRWSAQDAVVLKAMSEVLTRIITDRIDTRCHHVKGHGGLKGAVNSIRAHLQENMHGIVHRLKYKLAFNKTFIGRIERGFDFLGYRLGANGQIGLAKQTILNHWNKLSRLYEQSAPDQCVREYKTNWLRWVGAGLTGRAV